MTSFKRPEAVIVDVDGTLVDVSSVRHYVIAALLPDGSYKTKDFDAFHRESVNCPPIWETVGRVNRWFNDGTKILIVTARSERYYGPTAWWLAENNIPHHELYMRADRDFRPDYVIKSEILARITKRYNVIHAIDDNPAVIRLWEENGIETTVVPGWEEAA